MESLTRNNYEIWFLDYLDGQLSNDQLDTLLDFLEQNPDLKEELRGTSGVALKAGDETINTREMLLKTPADIPGISSIDQLCIARMENDLSPEETEKFDARLAEDIPLEENFTAFKLTRLNPADRVIYPYKKDLIKKTRTLTPWILTAISAAAIVVLVLLIWPTGDELAVGSRQLAENSQQSAAGSRQLAENSKKPAAGREQSAVSSQQSAVRSRQSGVGSRQLAESSKSAARILKPDTRNPIPETREAIPMNSLSRRTSIAGPKIPEPLSTKLLYASNYQPELKSSAGNDNILTLPQYALQLFREKILGEDRQLVKKTRFTMWEVAGAGVNGINSLAGTKMKLDREYDTHGTILAVSFNSKLVDVEAPVRGQSGR